MNQAMQTVRVGLFFVLGLTLIYVVYSVIGERKLRGAGGYSVVAVFDDVRTLARGADVRMAGVRIGEVEGTRLADGRGEAVLRIQPEFQIPADSVARMAVASLLGQNYIAVGYGSATQVLADGDRIHTESSADLNSILTQVGELGEKLNKLADGFSAFGGDDMSGLLQNLNAMVGDNRASIDRIVANIEGLTTRLNNGEGTLGRLISDDGLYDELMATVTEIRQAATDARDTLGGARDVFARLESGEGALGKLLYDDNIAAELTATIANLRSFSEKLNSDEGTLGLLLNDDSLYRDLRGMLGKADKALDSMGDSGPITALGALSNALF